MSFWHSIAAIAGLAVITLLSRSLFLLPDREVPLPQWLRDGLRYAPLAALVAVVAPEIFMTDGHLVATWQDARLYAAAVGVACYAWRRSILATIACGTGTLVLLRLVLGW
jgi:branched-subunit amino acid transport protein